MATLANPINTFAGGMDELKFYKRALSATEIKNLYNTENGGTSSISVYTPTFLDTDQDGIPDFWEDTFTPNLVFIPSNNNDRDGDGFTDLEEYDNWLAAPHALTTVTNAVGVDLYQLCGESGHLAFGVTNGVHGLIYLTNVLGSVTNLGVYSNSFAIFTPTNGPAGTNYFGYASFGFYVTNLDTAAYFGPVTVSVVISAVPILTNPPVVIHELTSGVASNLCNAFGSDYYHIVVTTNDYGAVFELDNRTGPMSLAVRYGLPLPSLSKYDYYTNAPAPPAPETISVLTNSTPVALAPGDWYMAAVNVSGSNVCYTALITKLSNILPPQFLYPTNTTTNAILETVSNTIVCVAVDSNTPPLPLTFALVNWPAGMTITNGVIYWTPTEAQGPSTNMVSVSVSNGAFSVTNTFTLIVEESNLPPVFVLTNIPNQFIIGTNTLVVTNAATDSDIPVNALSYTLLTAPNGAVIDTNGVITWTPTLAQIGTNYLFTTVVTDTNPWAVNAQSLSATNYFYVTVLPPLVPGLPQTNVVGSNSISWFAIVVPTNAVYATNTLIFATLPVNLWFSTNVPPTNNYELLLNRTNGSSVLSTNLATAPTNIVPGGTYFLGVQNTNSVAVTNAIEVDFALVFPVSPTLPVIPDQVITAGDTLVVTNTATDTNASAVLIYYLTNSPTGAVISTNGIITWVTMTNLAPTNYVITTVVTDTNVNLSATNSFNVIVLPGLIDDNPQTNVVGANGINWFAVKVPRNADLATNFLLFASAPVNFWFSTNVPPSVTNTADFEMLTNSIGGLRVIDTLSAPRLVPGTRYFLGVQNTNSFAVTNVVKVKFHLVTPGTNLVFFSIVQTNLAGVNGFLLTWFAPTNDQFHVLWTPALVPPSWTNFNGVISDDVAPVPTNGVFQYFDDGSQTGGFGPTRFYRLLLLNSPTNTAPVFLNTPTTLIATPQVPFVFTNAAKDWDVPAQTLTYSLSNSLAGINGAIINSNTGVITWTPTSAQSGLTNILITIVTDNGVPVKSATNVFNVVVSIPTNSATPFAATLPARTLSGTTALLGGFASPNGLTSYAWFDWGTSAGYGNSSQPLAVGNGFGVVWITNQINNLIAGQVYHARLVVSNSFGVGYGYDQTFGSGNIVAWGDDTYGQTDVPTGVSNLVGVAAGAEFSLGLLNNGSVTGWGDDTYNELDPLPSLSNMTAISAGDVFACALKNDGTVTAWGISNQGITNVPAGLNHVVAISAGSVHTLALKNNGLVTAWGSSFWVYGQSTVPAGLSNVVAVAGGGFFSMALKIDGTVQVWGDNSYGQTNVPAGLNNVVAIAAGANHCLALKRNGTVLAWGGNGFGQTNVPAGLNQVVAIAAGSGHDVAVKAGGSVVAWGDNSSGETDVPAGLTNAYALAIGPDSLHSLLLNSSFPVNATNTAPFFVNSPTNRFLNPLVTLTVTNNASDADVPAQTLTYFITNSLPGINGAVIDPLSGIITWTPTLAQSGVTNVITTVVSDNGVPAASVTNAFTVIVNALPPFSSVSVNTNGVNFQWTAFTNEQFQIRWTTNLAPPSWTLFPNILTSTNGIFMFVDTNTSLLMKFYELILLP